MKYFLLIFVVLLYSSLCEATVFSSSLKSCQDQCADKNLALPLARGELSWNADAIAACGYSCAVKSCHHGCHDLDEPISRCHARCSEEGIVFESCAQGCQAVEQAFLLQVQELVNSVSGSAEQVESGIRLIYTFPEAVSPQLQEIAAAEVRLTKAIHLVFSVQWIAHSRSKSVNFGWKWTPMAPTAFRNATLVADAILPEEKAPNIEFRLAIFYRNRVVVSHPIVYTQPNANPAYLLEITHQRQMGNDKVALCWKLNRANARVKLVMTTLDGTELRTMESSRRCHLLKNLPSENCCRVSFTDISGTDESSPATNSTNLEVKKYEDVLMAMNISPTAPKLLMVNGSHILQMRNVDDYVVTDEPIIVPFSVPEGDSLTAACGISSSELIVGSSRGGLWRVAMEFNETQIESDVIKLRDYDDEGNRIWQIVYDSINSFVYAVLGDKGILRCPTEKGNCTLAPNTDLLNPVRQIAVDAINGFLYFVSADHQVYKTPLFPFDSSESYTVTDVKSIPELASTSAIFFDWNNFELFASLKNSSVVVYDVISGEIREKRHTEYMEVSRLSALGERLFWTREKCGDSPIDAVCFYSEDQKNSEIEKQPYFSRYLYAATINDFTFLTTPAQPFSLAPFGEVSLIAADVEALITWTDSQPEPYAVSGHRWWNSTIELKVTQNNETSVLYGSGSNMTITVSPGVEYRIRLRRCLEDVCSSTVETVETAMSKLPSLPFVIVRKSSERLEIMDMIGRPLDMQMAIGTNIPLNISEPFALDNTTLSYFSVSSDVWVNQGSLDGSSTSTFTGYSAITHLASSPSRALLFVASPYQIISYRLTGTFDHTFYSCASATEECGQVVGLSVDDKSGEVHFALRMPKGTFVLFEANQEDRTPRLLSESASIPEIKQLLVTDEKVVFITKDGLFGVCDKHLENINFNLNLGPVSALLPLNPDRATNLGSFMGEVMMSPDQKARLIWNVEPRKIVGKTLFKVSLYKDKLGMGERRVEVTTENGLTLPSDLMEAWSSAQKFDINVEGFTAWTTISVNKTGLQAPVKPPGPPTSTSIYATQQKTVDGARAIISFFWQPPVLWNGAPFQYIVNCTKEDGSAQGGSVSSTVNHYSFAVKSGKVSCMVAASNEPSNIGSYTEAVTIDSSELKPLVRLFAIDSSNALMAITDISNDLTIRRQKRQTAQQMEYQAIAFIGNDLFAVRKEHDSVQPLLVQIDTNDIDNIVHKVSIGGDVGRIEAMTSDWVANRLLFVSGMALYQLSLDPFLTTSLLNPKKLIELSTVATDAKQLTFDPFKNIAYLLTRNGSLFSLNLWMENEQNLALAVPCLFSQTVTWMMTEFAWNRASSPKIYALTWNGLIVVDLEENNKCNEVRIDWNKFGEKGLKAVSAFAIADKLFVFVTSSEMLIYGREAIVPIPITNPPLRQILAVSQSSQPFPDRSCFTLPSSTGIQFTVVNEGKTGAFLDVQKPPLPTTCAGVSFPQTHYEVYFTRKNAEKVKHIRSFSDKIHVENGILDKETDYEITVAWLNRFSDVSGISDPKPFRTGFGYPSAPRELRVLSISPDTVYLYWTLPETLNAPINEIKYKVTQQGTGLSSPSTIAVQEFTDVGFTPLSTDTASCLSNPCRAKVSNLRASTEYKFWVTAIHTSHLNSQFLEDAEAASPEAAAKTKDVAGTLRPDNVTGSSILLRWNSLQAELPPASISVQYKETGVSMSETSWNTPTNASFDPSVPTLLILINNLLSATSYDYRFAAAYTGSYSIGGKEYSFKEEYFQGMQQIKTKAGVPTSPVNVEARIDEEGWIVSWQEPESNGGSPVQSYAVEMRINKTSEWEIAERGLDGWKMWWRPAKSNKDDRAWEFRVRAANAEGFGPYANTTDTNVPETETEQSPTLSYLLIALCCIIAFVAICLLFRIVLSYRRNQILKRKKMLESKNCITLEKMTGHSAPDEPLSAHMLRELKHLPIIDERDLKEIRLLGPDEKPYEISLCACMSPVTENEEVVVKRLSTKAPFTLKNKLIKEAILLNNFDHPHIIKLLGVCTTMEIRSPYMVLEYMNEGCLRDVLRNNSRAEQDAQLSLKELMSFMVDIGRAGDYLESQRHVYRGLSSKTCFVSNENGQRIVKLGDFGLVRGVFDDNYVYSEFEGFQPIRWCAPEVGLNLQFSTKSDIWAYGVVLFEIMTLGANPYSQCRTVDQVQSRLRTGDTPSRPRGCPEQICKIMRSCWARESEERPRFSELVADLETLRELSEFQDMKPFLPTGAHNNEAFDVSIDSSSSEKQDFKDQQLFEVSHRSSEQNRFDRSGNSLGGRKNSRPLLVRSQKREKTKPPPLPHPDEIDDRSGFSSSFRAINDNQFNFYEPPYSASAVGPPRSPFSSYSPFDLTTGSRRGYSTESESTRAEESGLLSKSWAAGGISLEPGKYTQQAPPLQTPTRRSPTSVVPPPLPQQRKGQRPPVLHQSSSGTNYQQKVSRV